MYDHPTPQQPPPPQPYGQQPPCGQSAYGQPPYGEPYGHPGAQRDQPHHQPQQQHYQQPPQNPYQQQPAPPYQQQPPYHQNPHAQPGHTAPARIPQHANDMRRIGAFLLDGVLALLVCAIALRAASRADLPFAKELLTVAGCGFGFSFLNHVVLTRLTGASIAKFATRTRVILQKTGARPRMPRLFKRWLGGYLVVVIWLIAALFDSADDDGPDDFCGIRLVRRRDLQQPARTY